MNEIVVKNLLSGLCKNHSDLTQSEQVAIRLFLDGKMSQNTLQSMLTKQ
jgi:hypothetical protein